MPIHGSGAAGQAMETPTVEQLKRMLAGGDPHWRVMPCFVEPGSADVEQGKAGLRYLLDDPEPAWTLDARDAGCARLRYMARIDVRCSDFIWVADLLQQQPPETRLLLGWSYRA